MFLPFILFVTLTVATAVIAHWSDNLGKKLGKKRVSLFGLRPRTTATVLTITSSWGIMLFTLVFLLVAVAPLRNALFHYERDRAQYRQDIGVAKEQLAGTRGKLDEAQDSYKTAQAKLKKAAEAVRTSRQDVAVAKKEALEAVGEGKIKAAEAQRRAAAAQAHFEGAQKRFLAAQSHAVQALKLETAARHGQELAELRIKKARSVLESTQGKLKNVNSELVKANQVLSNAKDAARRMGTLNLRLSTEITTLSRQLDRYSNIAAQLGGGEVSIPVGRTFAAGIIESGKSEKRIEENLRQLFTKGRAALPILEPTKGATLELLPLPEIVKGKIVLIQGDAIFQRLAQTIVKNEDATSVRLIAVRNFTAGETVIDARFVAVPVATAFHAGEEIASTTIDGNSGDAGVFHELTLLTDEGRDVAVRRKVNPPLSPQEPNFYAAGTNVALFAAMRRIEATGKVVKVKLVAADDLLTVERLRVRFEVEGDELED